MTLNLRPSEAAEMMRWAIARPMRFSTGWPVLVVVMLKK